MPIFALHAQEGIKQCECFCATDKGAVPPSGSLQRMTIRQCEDACTAKESRVAVCAFGSDQYPDRDVHCFTQEQCEAAVKVYCGDTAGTSEAYSNISCAPGGVDDSFETTYQPPECLPGQHYCYPPKHSTTVRLNIQIGDTNEVQDLEKYVSVLYQWMVTAGMVFAIVLIMIGGTQYVFGAASASQVKKGQDRIRNAVIGLVLLFSAILIIETVSPKLSSIAVPRLPMIKTIVVAGSGKSCELLHDVEKFTVGWQDRKRGTAADTYELYTGANSPGCGQVGAILKASDGSDMAAGSMCNFKQCEKEDAERYGTETEQCIGSGANARCLTCMNIFDGSPAIEGGKIVPSASTCGLFTQGAVTENGKVTSFQKCGWTKDTSFGGTPLQAATDGRCIDIRLNCEQIRGGGCSAYANASVYSNSQLFFLSAADTESDELACGLGSCSNFSYKTICEENPCDVETGCVFLRDTCLPGRHL